MSSDQEDDNKPALEMVNISIMREITEKESSIFKEKFNSHFKKLDSFSLIHEKMLKELDDLDEELHQLENRVTSLSNSKDEIENDLTSLMGALWQTRQLANISTSNPDLLFNQSFQDLKQYEDIFNLKVEPYFNKRGFKIIFKDINYKNMVNEPATESQDPVPLRDNNISVTGSDHWIDLDITDSILHLNSSSHPINIESILRDLNSTGDLRSFLILLKKTFREIN